MGGGSGALPRRQLFCPLYFFYGQPLGFCNTVRPVFLSFFSKPGASGSAGSTSILEGELYGPFGGLWGRQAERRPTERFVLAGQFLPYATREKEEESYRRRLSKFFLPKKVSMASSRPRGMQRLVL